MQRVDGTDCAPLLGALRNESFHPPVRLVEEPEADAPPSDGRLVVRTADAADATGAVERPGSAPTASLLVLLSRAGQPHGAGAGEEPEPVVAGSPLDSHAGAPLGGQVGSALTLTTPAGDAASGGAPALGDGDRRRLAAALHWHVVRPTEARRVRGVLAVLEELAWSAPDRGPDLDKLRYQLERFRSGAHELAEVDLAEALRAGDVRLTASDRAAAEQLLGAHGVEPAARLGLADDADTEAVRRAAAERLAYWQRVASHPASTAGVRDAAEVLVHTCEHLLAAGNG